MDRALFVAMTGARQLLRAQAINNQNLANASTPGYRQDLTALRAMPVFGDLYEGYLPTRVYALAERPGVDLSAGSHVTTGRSLDVAVDGEGWIAVQAPDGTEAYTRAGDLRLDPGGLLVTGAGHQVLGNAGPVAVPPAEALQIGRDGTLSVRPVGEPATTVAVVDRLRLVRPDPDTLIKDRFGLMRTRDGQPAPPDAAVRLVSETLEGSNVNAVTALVQMIELARGFETQIQMMAALEDNDRSSDQLLRLR